MLTPHQSVAQVVLDHSECAEVFKRHRIDFCCRGAISVEAAAQERGLDTEGLLAELNQAVHERRGGTPVAAQSYSTPALVAHIVTIHHGYLRKVLPFVQGLAIKVGRVHGDHNPNLRVLAQAVSALTTTLLTHLDEEEEVLFPALTARDRDAGRVVSMLEAMVTEHLDVAQQLERIRAASDDFALPEWACNSYRTLFSELQVLESDIFTHVHLENHVLRPRFV